MDDSKYRLVFCRHRNNKKELLRAETNDGNWWSFTPIRKDGEPKRHKHGGRVGWSGLWTDEYEIEK